ncbi:unnamed protein product [Withania somnifera]
MDYWNTASNDVLAFDMKNEVIAVLYVPIPPWRYGALTLIEDEMCYVTTYNDCGDAFILYIYGGVDMSLKRSICINLGHKKSSQAFEKIPFIDNVTVFCRVLTCFNSADDIVTLMSPGQLNPQRRFILYINNLVRLHELKN